MSDNESEVIFVKCPECRKTSELLKSDFTIDHHGKIYPDFVCMSKTNGDYCPYTGPASTNL